MTLRETPSFDSLSPSEDTGFVEEPDLFDLVREAVESVMLIEQESELNQLEQIGRVYRGRLLMNAEIAYDNLEARLDGLGFTPLLQRIGTDDAVLVFKGTIAQLEQDTGGGPMRRLVRASRKSRWWLHALLLVLTIISTTFSGAILLQTGPLNTLGDWIAMGGPFAFTLLFILGVHEMGHYVAARFHKVDVTLPFFSPLPLLGLGTLGAVIFIRSPLTNRRKLFDVGISGPLAGLVVAIPLFLIGLSMEPAYGAPITQVFDEINMPPLLEILGDLATSRSLSRAVLLHPVALAAWFGVLLTALNLLPLGQFDGGHVSYALFGRFAWQLAIGVFAVLIMLGISLWAGWLIWAFLAVMSGLRHPPPQNDITPLNAPRRVLGFVTLAIFLLIFVPLPFVEAPLAQSDPDFVLPTPVLPDFPTPTPYIFD